MSKYGYVMVQCSVNKFCFVFLPAQQNSLLCNRAACQKESNLHENPPQRWIHPILKMIAAATLILLLNVHFIVRNRGLRKVTALFVCFLLKQYYYLISMFFLPDLLFEPIQSAFDFFWTVQGTTVYEKWSHSWELLSSSLWDLLYRWQLVYFSSTRFWHSEMFKCAVFPHPLPYPRRCIL